MEIISKLNTLNWTDDDIKNMLYQERCNTLNKNWVIVARHFQYGVKVSLKVIVLNGPLDKTRYFAVRVEFQVRGSPHVHSFIWILNALNLSKESKEEGVDSIMSSGLIALYEQTCQTLLTRKSVWNSENFSDSSAFKDKKKISKPEMQVSFGKILLR